MNEHLLSRILTGEATSDEKEIFYEHLSNNKKDEDLFYEIKSLWLRSSMHKNNSDSDREFEILWKKINKKDRKPTTLKNRILRYAAIFILLLGIGNTTGYFISKETTKLPETNIQKYTSTKGSVSIIEFDDGTKVWLNSDSKLTYYEDPESKERFAELTGEAYFNVAKDEHNSRFYVTTTDIKIEVLGTEFNVKSYPNEGVIETTLEEGEIVLYKNSKNDDTKITTMQPNQHAVFIKKKGELFLDAFPKEKQSEIVVKEERKEELIITESIDTEKYVAWKDGHLIIDGESFESFVSKLERRYNVQIVLKDERIRKLHFTANFKNETIEQALDALTLAHPFNYNFNIEQNMITIE